MSQKTKPSTDDSTTAPVKPSKPAKTDREIAEFSVRCLYGCGIPESQERLQKYEDTVIKAIADAERENRRDRVPNILAKAQPVKPQPAKIE